MGSRGQTQTTEQTVDPRIQGMHTDLYGDVSQYMTSHPYEAYQGQLVAGVDPMMAQAGGMLSSGLEGGVGQTPGAMQVATDLGGFQAPNVNGGSFLGGPGIGAYMNPYTDQVVNTALSDVDRSRQMAQVGNASGATQAGAFGGDRHAIVEAETNRAYADQAARTSAQLRSQGFDTAAGLYGQDLNRGLQAGMANQSGALGSGQIQLGAGGLMGQLGNQQFNQLLAGSGAMNAFGAQNRDITQQELAANYQQYLDAQNDPYRRFAFQQGMLSGIPYGTSTTSSQPGNQGAGIAGGMLSGAGMGAQIGSLGGPIGVGLGTGLGAGIGLLGGLFG